MMELVENWAMANCKESRKKIYIINYSYILRYFEKKILRHFVFFHIILWASLFSEQWNNPTFASFSMNKATRFLIKSFILSKSSALTLPEPSSRNATSRPCWARHSVKTKRAQIMSPFYFYVSFTVPYNVFYIHLKRM